MAQIFIWASIGQEGELTCIGVHDIPQGTESPERAFVAALRETADTIEEPLDDEAARFRQIVEGLGA